MVVTFFVILYLNLNLNFNSGFWFDDTNLAGGGSGDSEIAERCRRCHADGSV